MACSKTWSLGDGLLHSPATSRVTKFDDHCKTKKKKKSPIGTSFTSVETFHTHTHIPRLRSVTSSKDWKYRPNENHQLHPLYPSFVGCILMFETTPQNLWVTVEPVAAPPVPCVGCPCAWSEGSGPPPEASAAHAAVNYTAWAGVDVSPPCAHDSRLALDPHNALHLGVDNPEQQPPRFCGHIHCWFMACGVLKNSWKPPATVFVW